MEDNKCKHEYIPIDENTIACWKCGETKDKRSGKCKHGQPENVCTLCEVGEF